ncbi:HTH-type transcriptional repressor FatR [Rossellomorea marisflavi]|uniref:TetR/AcrR family transcriptional regulator n=1 Tax=Rossellomorea marisflavi TaxID=189381 RepID=UPI0025CADFBD|nr:TetR/AcrR family transcriptional regulator [Rossellomorea marisflavi]GLI85810.1 HTH-type transcriptional repressor FatR [Rossellomorea marisflavi]
MTATLTKRQSIIHVALKIFSERGFDATTIPMIATEAGVGAGTIYRYFENKEVLGNHLFQDNVTRFTESLRSNYPYSSSIREQFHHIFSSMISFTTCNPHALYFIKMHSHAHFLNKDSLDCFSELTDLLGQFFEWGKTQEELKPLPSPVLFSIIYGAFLELQRIVETGDITPDASLLLDVEESLWNAIQLIKPQAE